MQTIFRLPWSTEPSGDKALAEKFQYGPHKPRPRVELAPLNTGKRKRMDSADVSPGNAQYAKKPKSEHHGAVQPTLEPARGADARASFAPTEAGASSDKTTENSVRSLQVSAGGGNAPQVVKVDEAVSSLPQTLQPQQSTTVADAPKSRAPTIMAATPSLSTATNSSAMRHDSMADESVRLDRLRAVIEHEFNLEIIHKHHELRLIEQEIAKCQIGLEQLRRCEVIPYPGSSRPSQAVSTGMGAALQSAQGYAQPEYAAPWGVTDGPYSRHYAKWLIHDPSFDPSPIQSSASTPMTARGIRATRGSGAEPLLPVPTARHSRTSTGGRNTLADPSTPTTMRDPMIMKRQADGEWVRLRCPHDGRSNFNNVQGFLNHCRIAHHQLFESHEQAAITCGEIVHVDENQYVTVPAPAARETVVQAPVIATPTDQPLVSPFIVNAPAFKPLERILTHPFTPDATPQTSPSTAAPTVASNQTSLTPSLARLMERRGLSTANLDLTVKENKKKVNLSVYDNSDSEDASNDKKRRKTKKPKGAVRHPSSGQYSLPGSTNLGSARPTSQKGLRAPSAIPTQAQYSSQSQQPFSEFSSRNSSATFTTSIVGSPTADMDGDTEMGLSPGTADSNPGLVSDHEDDYDDVDEDARSASGGHHIEIIDGIAVEIEDGSDVEGDGRKRVVRDGDAPICRSGGMGVAEGSDRMD